MKTVLVTGGAGFIGSHTVDALVALGGRVVVFDDFSSGFKRNVHASAIIARGSVTNAKRVQDVFKEYRPTHIVHLAAQKSVRASVADPVADARINIEGSLNVLQAAVHYKVQRVVFASTGGALYGDGSPLPTPEVTPCQPVSPYGVAKLTVEKYLHFYHQQYGLSYAALRYANVYGPRQDPHGEAGVVAIFCESLINNKRARIYGDGKQTRDYVYVGDVVAANVRALQAVKVGSWNIGTEQETNVNKLYAKVAIVLQSGVQPIHAPARPGEQRRSSVRIALAKKDLGWKPAFSLEQGLQETANWFASHKR